MLSKYVSYLTRGKKMNKLKQKKKFRFQIKNFRSNELTGFYQRKWNAYTFFVSLFQLPTIENVFPISPCELCCFFFFSRTIALRFYRWLIRKCIFFLLSLLILHRNEYHIYIFLSAYDGKWINGNYNQWIAFYRCQWKCCRY